jgi:hypothetical protein
MNKIKSTPKKPQGTTNKKPKPLIPGKIRLCNIRAARRILSKLIAGFINQEVEDNKAKVLTYLLSTYVNIARDTDIESRLVQLESIIDKEQKK